jgi:hypothetical protein
MALFIVAGGLAREVGRQRAGADQADTLSVIRRVGAATVGLAAIFDDLDVLDVAGLERERAGMAKAQGFLGVRPSAPIAWPRA